MRPWFVPARTRAVEAAPVRAVEATPDQLIASGAVIGSWSRDPVDGDVGWKLAGSVGREVPYWSQEKARAYSIAAYRINPMAKAIIDTYCVDEATEILTVDGWRRYDEVKVDDEVLTLNHETGLSEWQPVLSMHIFPAQSRKLVHVRTRDHSSLTTENHRWPTLSRCRVWQGKGWAGYDESRAWRTSDTLSPADSIIRAALPAHPPVEAKWSDDLVELVAWTYTEGHIRASGAVILTQSITANPDYVARIDATLRRLYGPPSDWLYRRRTTPTEPRWLRIQYGNNVRFKLSKEAAQPILTAAPDKVPALAWLRELTPAQLRLFIDVSLMADGDSDGLWPQGRTLGCHLAQKDRRRSEAFQYALILSGVASSLVERSNDGHWKVSAHRRSATAVSRAVTVAARAGSTSATRAVVEHHGIVWCPRTANGTWFARREGTTYFTGNTSFCVGDSGVTLQVTNPEVNVVAQEFWTDPRNCLNMQDLFLRDLMLNGETSWEIMQGAGSGVVRFSPFDPSWIVKVLLLNGNPLWPSTVVLGQNMTAGTEGRELSVVMVQDDTGLRDGECIFWTPWKALVTDRRGMPFMSAIVDQLDSYDTIISNLVDRTALARYLVWDVTVTGGQDAVDAFVASRGGIHIPQSGSVEVHNDSVKWEPKTAPTGAMEDSQAASTVLTQVAGGAGLSKHWLSEPEGTNRATSHSMAEPVRRRVGGVQKTWLGYMTEFNRLAIDRAVAAGRLPKTVTAKDPRTGKEYEIPAAMCVSVTGPEIAAADAQVTAQVLLNLSTGLGNFVKNGIMSPAAANLAARKAWEQFVGVPYTADLDQPQDENPDSGSLSNADLSALASYLEEKGGKSITPGGEGRTEATYPLPYREALGRDTTPGHDELHHYWVAGPGLAEWRASPKPFTTLVDLLVEHVKPPKPLATYKKWAAAWFHEVFGFWPGADLNRVTHGQPPRGHLVGPG